MRVGVLGIGKTPHKIQHGKSLRDLVVESGRAAMADAGVEPADIQALYVGNVGLGRLQLRELDRADGRPTTSGWCRPGRCASRPPAAPAPGPCTWAAWRSCRGSTTP